LLAVAAVVTSARGLNGQTTRPARTTLKEEAVRARTEVKVLHEQTVDLEPRIRRLMRAQISRGEADIDAGNVLLFKDRYSEALATFQKAAALLREALDGR